MENVVFACSIVMQRLELFFDDFKHFSFSITIYNE